MCTLFESQIGAKRASIHLTDIVVQRLKTPSTYFDETTPAFGVRVGKNRKTWIVMRGKIRERVRIGHYPSIGLADARKEGKKLLAQPPAVRSGRATFSTAYELKVALEGKKRARSTTTSACPTSISSLHSRKSCLPRSRTKNRHGINRPIAMVPPTQRCAFNDRTLVFLNLLICLSGNE
ncbi:Arm DNA-binding domain-containing protein [Bradyrhizobium zhanjiangense]|uniref:Arm DNA-binding domain-containing protein n=1 Tax=Bradyrhizobium zhanjiangense TaxID=1325107 RepID=UPI0013E8A7ED|nr:Arm DNA-binding domain-containing protein [Bradyrhizobium zhanjiangense]